MNKNISSCSRKCCIAAGDRVCRLVWLLSLLALVVPAYITEPVLAGNTENKQTDKKQSSTDAKKKPPRPKHTHPAFAQRRAERKQMVSRHIRGGGVRDPNVLRSLTTVPRHSFVRGSDLKRAYRNHPLSIGMGQTISQPYIVGYMTEAMKIGQGSRVLEIGTGSGYQAAVCAEIAGEVFSIEIIAELAESATRRLQKLGYANVTVKAADGYFGWKEKGPFDAIIVTCAAGFVPPQLLQQLKPKGRMVVPVGSPYGAQTLMLITKDVKGNLKSRRLLPVRFVPMLGRVTDKK